MRSTWGQETGSPSIPTKVVSSHRVGESCRHPPRSICRCREKVIVPSVMINGTRRRTLTSVPLTNPQAAPQSTDIAIEGCHIPQPARRPTAATHPDNAKPVPTDKSMPPEIMIMVMPNAAIATFTLWTPTNRADPTLLKFPTPP